MSVLNFINILRQESGAAITAEERKFIRSLVTPRGKQALVESPETTFAKIQSLSKRISSTLNLLQPNEQVSNFVKSALGQGFSKDEIYALLMKKGMI